jgi:hypothetical protein
VIRLRALRGGRWFPGRKMKSEYLFLGTYVETLFRHLSEERKFTMYLVVSSILNLLRVPSILLFMSSSEHHSLKQHVRAYRCVARSNIPQCNVLDASAVVTRWATIFPRETTCLRTSIAFVRSRHR